MVTNSDLSRTWATWIDFARNRNLFISRNALHIPAGHTRMLYRAHYWVGADGKA